MYVGVLRLTLQVPAARSLKDKRRVVRSLKDRLQAKLPVSVADVGGLNAYQRAVVAVAVVSGEAARVDELMSAAASMAGRQRDAVLADRASEVIAFGDEGAGVRGGIEEALDDGSWEDFDGPTA